MKRKCTSGRTEEWKEEGNWLFSLIFSCQSDVAWIYQSAFLVSALFALTQGDVQMRHTLKHTHTRARIIILYINPFEDRRDNPNISEKSGFHHLCISVTGSWPCFGQTGEIVNVGNLVPPCLRVSAVTVSSVKKQGQGDSCHSPFHTIWMESDTSDSWGCFRHLLG